MDININFGTSTITDAIDDLTEMLREGFNRMSEQSDQLTSAVNNIADKVFQVNETLQVEMQQISAALANAGDSELREVVITSVARLNSVSTQLDAMTDAVQGIIP